MEMCASRKPVKVSVNLVFTEMLEVCFMDWRSWCHRLLNMVDPVSVCIDSISAYSLCMEHTSLKKGKYFRIFPPPPDTVI